MWNLDTLSREREREINASAKNGKNFLIEGDNYASLKLLEKTHKGKIDLIYIDPPYNTGNKDFVYNDSFVTYDDGYFHSKWLSFIEKRLKLAKDLLKDDGLIFVSIDDNEQANLKLLMDKIFGQINFVSTFIIDKTAQGANQSVTFKTQHEYCLLYKKNSPDKINYEIDTKCDNKKFKYRDEIGLYAKTNSFDSINSPLSSNRNRGYTIYYRETDGDAVVRDEFNRETLTFDEYDKTLIDSGYIPIRPGIRKNVQYPRNWEPSRFLREYKQELVFCKNQKGVLSVYHKNRFSGKTKDTTIKKFDTRQQGNELLVNILGIKKFDYPKSLDMMKWIISKFNDKNALVLDFFAGSGTTAHAVMELNAEDSGNRKFILCQIDEEIKKEKSAAYDFCIDNNFEPVISSITVERVNRAGDKILKTLKESNDMFDDKKIDIGYKVFDLHDVNIEKEDENKQIILLLNGVTDLSRIYNMIINIGLNSPVSKLTPIIENCAYMIEEDNIKRYYITNSEILIKNDENKQKFKDMIESGMVYIDGWTVTINVSLQQYKDNVKIVL